MSGGGRAIEYWKVNVNRPFHSSDISGNFFGEKGEKENNDIYYSYNKLNKFRKNNEHPRGSKKKFGENLYEV